MMLKVFFAQFIFAVWCVGMGCFLMFFGSLVVGAISDLHAIKVSEQQCVAHRLVMHHYSPQESPTSTDDAMRFLQQNGELRSRISKARAASYSDEEVFEMINQNPRLASKIEAVRSSGKTKYEIGNMLGLSLDVDRINRLRFMIVAPSIRESIKKGLSEPKAFACFRRTDFYRDLKSSGYTDEKILYGLDLPSHLANAYPYNKNLSEKTKDSIRWGFMCILIFSGVMSFTSFVFLGAISPIKIKKIFEKHSPS